MFITLLLSFSCVVMARIPVSVMMNLDLMNGTAQVTDETKTAQWLTNIKNQGADGIMVDLWWGLIERAGPQNYDWSGYEHFFSIVEQVGGLDIQVVFSFHKCGGNVGDTCNFPLPKWVENVRANGPNFWYTARNKWEDPEYISLGADEAAIFPAKNGRMRTPIDMYRDLMASFVAKFKSKMPHLINEAQIGAGPAGELRYPGYPMNDGWNYPGVGGFMCYDDFLLNSLRKAAAKAGNPAWGNGGPANVGGLNNVPSNSGFFKANGNNNYASAYGQFFLNWYSKQLLMHADRVLSVVGATVGKHVPLAMKVSGIHWWYLDPSHAAEATSGYYNTNGHNAYASIALVFKKHNATFDFTCLEMTNPSNGGNAGSAPASLVMQTRQATARLGVPYAGENALPVCYPGGCNQNGFNEIVYESSHYGNIERFTLLRIGKELFGNNFNHVKAFINQMHST